MFTVVFSEPIKASSFTASDISLTGTTGAVTGFTQVDSRTWTVTVTGMTDGDTVQASLPDNIITDLAGNLNTASTSTDNSVTYDATAPAVTINQASGQADPTDVDSATFTVVFSKPVSGLIATDFALAGTTGGITSLTTTNNQTYTVVVTGMTNGDTATVSLPANIAQDGAGNGNQSSTSLDNAVTYDTTPASITITAPTKTKNTNITDTTITIQDAVGISAANVVATGGTLTCTQANPTKVTCTVVVTASGDLVVTAIDNAGNTATATEASYLIDTNAPTATFTYSTTAPTNQPVTITMTTNKPIATPAGWTKVSDTEYTKTVSANTTSSNNTVTITDSAGNSNTLPFSVTNIDTTAPQGTVTSLVTTSTSPALTGTVDTDATTVDVVINGTTYHAVVSGGTWSLPAGSIAPALTVGSYSIDVIAIDAVGNTSTKTATNALTILSDSAPLTSHSPNEGTHPAVNGATMAVTGGTCQSGFYDYKSLSPVGVSAPQSNVMIIGGLTYHLSCAVLGGNATVDVTLGTFYSNLSLLKIYKQIDGKMVDITGQVNLRNSGNTTLFTVSLTDGATNDEDNQQNKEILDPVYIGIIDPSAALTNTGHNTTGVLFAGVACIIVGYTVVRRLRVVA